MKEFEVKAWRDDTSTKIVLSDQSWELKVFPLVEQYVDKGRIIRPGNVKDFMSEIHMDIMRETIVGLAIKGLLTGRSGTRDANWRRALLARTGTAGIHKMQLLHRHSLFHLLCDIS